MDTFQVRFQASIGHRWSARHPQMQPHLLPRSRTRLDFIDPSLTQASLAIARRRLKTLRSRKACILWVGARHNAHLLKRIHQFTGDPVIHRRWPGGLLTNFRVVCTGSPMPVPALDRFPDAVFALSVAASRLAVAEGTRCGVEMLGVVDSNADPGPIRYPIFGNDDSLAVLEYYLESLGVLSVPA